MRGGRRRVRAGAARLGPRRRSAVYQPRGSFAYNFLIRGERHEVTIKELMKAPYPRIMIMQLAVIVGGFLTEMIGQPLFMLTALIVIKPAIDLHLHNREQRAIAVDQGRASTARASR